MKKNGNNTQTGQLMSEMLEEYNYERPKKGQFAEAEIMQIDQDRILVDLGGKTDAVVTPREMKKTDESLISDLSIGDIVPVYVLRPPTLMRKPTVSLQRGAEKVDWDQAEDLLERKQITKLKISGKNKGGLLVEFGKITGFLPASLIPTVSRAPGRKYAEKIKSALIGEEIYLSVLEVKPKRKRLIFSAREQEEKIAEKVIQEIEPGDVRKGIVVNLVDFGAFINLFGVDGLLHISEMSWERVEDPADILSIGDKVEVKILKIDQENQQVGLSRKALLDPFGDYALTPEIEHQ